MKTFTTSRVVHVPPDIAYRVAADVPAYKDFLPLLQRSIVRGTRQAFGNGEKFKAELVVAVEKLGLRESFVSDVTTDPVTRTVHAMSVEGPLHTLNVHWKIADANGGCEVTVAIDYGFKSRMLQFAASQALELATPRIMKAFEDRAMALARQSGI
jgi:ribosome-associated toxin RatA of RatAB toxin-antitoxin module